MKKVLLIAGISVAVLGGGLLVTQALFSDAEKSADNTIVSGTMDLSVDGKNGTAFDSIDIENVGVTGTTSGEKEWTVNNIGSLPGTLTLSMNKISNDENGCNEPELEVETSCAGDSIGELGGSTGVVVKIDSDADGNYEEEQAVITSTLATSNQSSYAQQWTANAGTVSVAPGESKKVKLFWTIDSNSYGNEVQSDSTSFQVQFNLTQTVAQQ